MRMPLDFKTKTNDKAMKISVLRTCRNCDFWHSNTCDAGMRRKRTEGKCKDGKGEYCTCTMFQVWGIRP